LALIPMTITDAQLQHLEMVAQAYEDRSRRAEQRHQTTRGWKWYFALCGVASDTQEFDYSPIARLQRVEEPPTVEELAWALRNKRDFSAIGRYSGGITWELAVGQDRFDNPVAFTIGSAIIAMLRARTCGDVLVPAVADRSWSAIAAVRDGSCVATLIEDVPRARCVTDPLRVAPSDASWVFDHLANFLRLSRTPSFDIAIDAITTHAHQSNLRTAAAHLWTGVEALFGVQFELRFRVALYVASVLEPRGQGRIELYREMKKLYDTRSRVVHGSKVSDDVLEAHLSRVRRLLGCLICDCVERGRVPSESELDEMLLGQ